jgi:hypothetical protein
MGKPAEVPELIMPFNGTQNLALELQSWSALMLPFQLCCCLYVAAVDNSLGSPSDNRTIGIILCRSKTTVEYALQEMGKPIGVSTFQLSETLPETLRDNLPSAEQLEMQIEAIATELENKAVD